MRFLSSGFFSRIDSTQAPDQHHKIFSKNIFVFAEIFTKIFPGNNTWKAIDFRVLIPGNRNEKTLFREYLHENEKFVEKYLGGLLIYEKKTDIKNLMLVSLYRYLADLYIT